jgi:aminoglycoside phosphotransferase (APT) family kinase protein
MARAGGGHGAGQRVKSATGAVWEEALGQVPGAESGADIQVQALAGGTTNATFRVQTPAGRFVVRLHEPYTLDLGVDRKREAVLHAAAAAAGLASRVLAADPAGRYLVTEFLDAAPWREADLADEKRLWALAHTLRELHALPAPKVAPVELRTLLERHLAQIGAQDGAAAQGLRPQVARALDILARQADADRPACVVHGDLSHANVMGTGQPRLIDWEYAAVADPLRDLACLAAYYPPVLAHGTALLRRCGLPGSVTLAVLEELAWVYRLLSNMWYRRLELARRHPPPAH